MAIGELKQNLEDSVILGGGILYLGTSKENVEDVGAISGGASLEYSVDTTEVESDNRGTLLSFLSKENVTFKTGVISWNLDNLAKLCPATVTKEAGKKKIAIGGKASSLPINVLVFQHTKKDGKKLTVTMEKAQSQGSFTLEFSKDNPLSVDYAFNALAQDDGTLVTIEEEVGTE